MLRKKRRSTSEVQIVEDTGDFQQIRLSGYIFRPDEADQLLKTFQRIQDAPKVLLDLRQTDWLNSIGVAALAQVVIPIIEAPDEREVYIVVNEKFKRRYFDERPWAEDRVFETVEEIPNFS